METQPGIWLPLVCVLSCSFCVSLQQSLKAPTALSTWAMFPSIHIISVKYKQNGLCLQP